MDHPWFRLFPRATRAGDVDGLFFPTAVLSLLGGHVESNYRGLVLQRHARAQSAIRRPATPARIGDFRLGLCDGGFDDLEALDGELAPQLRHGLPALKNSVCARDAVVW